MRNKKRFVGIAAMLMLVLPVSVLAQSSSINAFSPYTFYGLGDLSIQGPAHIRAMGGAGVGYRSGVMVNYLNPAGLSTMSRNTFLFNVEFEGQNFYAKTNTAKTSFNTFNIRDVVLQFPVYKRMAIGFSMTPLSNVGYRVDMYETDPAILANIGAVRYIHRGEGGVTQFKLSYGAQLFKGFSLGADLVYYKGDLDRYYETEIVPVINNTNYYDVAGSFVEEYSKLSFTLGAQYNIMDDGERILTLGATFQPKTNLKPQVINKISTSSPFNDTVFVTEGKRNYYLPTSGTIGFFYQSRRLGIGLDYSLQHWKGLNPGDAINAVTYTNHHSIKLGAEYTPNRIDIYSWYNRWTYRAGVRYGSHYLKVNGNEIHDIALTLGLGIPIRIKSSQGLSYINLGAELGRRGSTKTGFYGTRRFEMIRENYFKFSIGFSLFGEDYWFMKPKYD